MNASSAKDFESHFDEDARELFKLKERLYDMAPKLYKLLIDTYTLNVRNQYLFESDISERCYYLSKAFPVMKFAQYLYGKNYVDHFNEKLKEENVSYKRRQVLKLILYKQLNKTIDTVPIEEISAKIMIRRI